MVPFARHIHFIVPFVIVGKHVVPDQMRDLIFLHNNAIAHFQIISIIAHSGIFQMNPETHRETTAALQYIKRIPKRLHHVEPVQDPVQFGTADGIPKWTLDDPGATGDNDITFVE